VTTGAPPSPQALSAHQPVIETLPLRRDSCGAAVVDLHHRLRRAGEPIVDEEGYGPDTEAAIRRFQADRGIRVDGICGRQTWSALVDAGWRLGDRLLYERTPMLRGDDVADLQSRLGGLGFLDDRVDAILGPRSRSALQDFQRNCGLTVDGICGPATIAELARVGARTPIAVKAGVLERARLRAAPRQLAGRRVLIGDHGGAGALAAAIERVLHTAGATAAVTLHPDGSVQAHEANDWGAEVYLGLSIGGELDDPRCAYYATEGFTSDGGERLATLLAIDLATSRALDGPVAVAGMRLPVLRETRMPAVVCELAPARTVVERGASLARVVSAAIEAWVEDPLPAAR